MLVNGVGALLALLVMSAVFGAGLRFAAHTLRSEADPVVEKIDALLPQTQCGECGYPGCRPYAEAVFAGAEANLCLPGGQTTAKKLAALLGRKYKRVIATYGDEPPQKTVAFILEDECIGCTKCIQACPVDAIIGAAKLMHTVIADECTGCDLCVDPCPVDCIEMRPISATLASWRWDKPTGPGSSPGKLIAVRNVE